jgi:glycosyltransferase involved in cell wall biosynthesis
MGRTAWDYACVKRINPDIQYHTCNETLRDIFYTESWNFEQCEKHSIFVSQCDYSIKGFHLMIEAMADIVKRYPDAQLYTTGKDHLSKNWKQKLKQKYYHKYIADLISQYGLEKNVHFIGGLSAEKMCERICRSHVCVCSSSVENSSNFVGESMLVGTPVVASCVGGIQTLLKDGEEGYIYQFDAPYMLAHYVMQIFENEAIAKKFSENSRIRAAKTHDQEVNFLTMMEIYNHIRTKGEKT